jgi:hypothetical protein
MWCERASIGGVCSAKVEATVPIARGGADLHADAHASEHVDERLAIELLDVSVEQVARPRLRDAEHVDERWPSELVLAGNIQQEVEEPRADAHVFHLRSAESRVPLRHCSRCGGDALIASSNDVHPYRSGAGATAAFPRRLERVSPPILIQILA